MYLDFYETHLPEEVYEKTFERLLSKLLKPTSRVMKRSIGKSYDNNAIVFAVGAGKIVGYLVHFIFHPKQLENRRCLIPPPTDLYVSDRFKRSSDSRTLVGC